MIRLFLFVALVAVIALLAFGVNVAAVLGIAYLCGIHLTLAQGIGVALALAIVGNLVRQRAV